MKKLILSALVIFSGSAIAGECYVTVKTAGGNDASGVRVTGDVSYGGMTNPVYTRNGTAVIKWSSNNKLNTVYVDGKDIKESCRNGGSVYHQM